MVSASPAMCVRHAERHRPGQPGRARAVGEQHQAPPQDRTRLPIDGVLGAAGDDEVQRPQRQADRQGQQQQARPERVRRPRRPAAPKASGARTASCVPQRCPCASRPTRPDGHVGDRPPHVARRSSREWSRSGSMANPPAAATQATCATVPCDRGPGQRRGARGEAGQGMRVTEHAHRVAAPPGARPAPAEAPSDGVSRRDRRPGRAPPRASQVASRSTGTSKSGNWSTNACIWSASQARVTCSSPRRSASSSRPAVGEVHRGLSPAKASATS